MLRDEGSPSSEHPWPGKMEEARRLAMTLGRPKLVEALATIIQECAVATWIAPAGT